MASTAQLRAVTSDDSPVARRSYLRALGAAAATGALAGCGEWWRGPTEPTATETQTETTTDTPSETETTADRETPGESDLRDRFETVVNVVDAGADPEGSDPVDPVLDEHAADDTMLYFPPGRYLLTEWELTGHRNLGVVGDGATLVPPSGKQDYWLRWSDLEEFLCSGFVLDCREEGVAPVSHVGVTGGRSVVRDVALRGHRRVPSGGFEIAVADPDAELLFEDVRLPDGSTAGNGIYTFPRSVGKLTLKDCRVEHWSEGLYASPHSGPIEVVGGYYANNGIDQVRVGGGPEGAVVRDVTVRVDNPKQPDSKPNMRGIWMEEGANVHIRDCDVAITDLTGTYSSGGIVVGRQFGSATIENTVVRTDADAPAIHLRDHVDSMEGQTMPSMDRLPDDWTVTCRNVRITGSAGSGTAIRAAGRNGCTFENVCIDHPNGSRDGIRVLNAEGCTVGDSTISVGGEAVRTQEASVETRDVRRSGSCET